MAEQVPMLLWSELADLDEDAIVTLLAKATKRTKKQIARAVRLGRGRKVTISMESVIPEGHPVSYFVKPRGVIRPHGRYLGRTDARRAQGAHYTPPRLTDPIVRTVLKPLIERLGEAPTPEQILTLKICDPAMGSGAFLVQVVRQLAESLTTSWETRSHSMGHVLTMPFATPSTGESDELLLPESREERLVWAKRFIAQHCVYGVDKNKNAVEMAKLSLWIATLSTGRAFTFLDHALRHGDALVGVTWPQALMMNLRDPSVDSGPLFSGSSSAIANASRLRSDLYTFSPHDYQRKSENLEQAERLLAKVRTRGDLCIAAFFGADRNRQRDALMSQYRAAVEAGDLEGSGASAIKSALEKIQEEHTAFSPFHWELEFAEVFARDPAGFDAFVGNPPWGAELSKRMKQYLKEAFPVVTGSAPDSFAYFVALGLKYARGKRFGFLLPDTFLTKNYKSLRKLLLPSIRTIHWYENAASPASHQLFKGVQMDVCFVAADADTTVDIDARVYRVIGGEWAARKPVSKRSSMARPELGWIINLTLRESDVQAWEKVRYLPKLGDIVGIHEGIHSGNIRKHLFLREKKRGDEKPLFVGARAGDHIEDFFAVRSGWFVDYRAELAGEIGGYATLGEESIFTEPKVLVTRTGNPFKAFVNSSDYASNNFFSLQFRKREDNTLNNLYLLAAFVRSALAQYFVRVHLAPRMGNAFTETKIKHLKSLPFDPAAMPQAAKIRIREETRRIESLKKRRFGGENLDADIEGAVAGLDLLIFEIAGFPREDVKELIAHPAIRKK